MGRGVRSFLGYKACSGGGKSDVRSAGATRELHLELVALSIGEVTGIPRVAGECVDIREKTSGGGGLLDNN